MAFEILQDQFLAAMTEVGQQNADLFNANSGNAMRVVPKEMIGDFSKKNFLKNTSSLITRQDITAGTNGAATSGTSDLEIGVRVYRRFQHEDKMNDIKRIGYTPEEYSFYMGQQMGQAMLEDMVNTGLLSIVTTLGKSANNYVTSTGAILDYDDLADGLAKFGDKAGNIATWIGHSKQAFDLLKASYDVQVESVAGVGFRSGGVPTLGRVLGITDSDALVDADGAGTTPDVKSYKWLGLQQDALVLEQRDEVSVTGRLETGKENLIYRTQGEYSYVVRVKGFSYEDTTANPNDSALGTAGNWAQVASDTKNTAGFFVETK